LARLGPILMGTLTAGLTWKLAYWVTQDRTIANRALAILLVVPISLVGTTILFTDTPLAVIWLGAVWITLIAVERQRLRWWILLGVVMGLGLNTKFLIFGLAVMLFVLLVLDPRGRRSLRTSGPYLAVVVAVLMWWPLIYWNVIHGWQTFYFNFVKRGSAMAIRPGGLLAFSIQQVILVGPLLYIWTLIYPAWWGWGKFRENKIRAFGILLAGYVPFMVYGALKLFRPVNTSTMNWTPPLFTLIAIILAWGASESKWARRVLVISVRISALWTCLVIGGLIGEFFVGPEPIRAVLAPYVAPRRLNRYLVDFFSWYPVGQELDILYRKYNAQAPTFPMARTYMHASNLSQYTREVPLCLSLGTDAMYGRCFDYWNEPEKQKGKNCLYFSNHQMSPKIEKVLKNAFESVQELSPAERIYIDPVNTLFHVYYCRNAKYLPGAADAGGPELQN
jgi:hypothetical protein